MLEIRPGRRIITPSDWMRVVQPRGGAAAACWAVALTGSGSGINAGSNASLENVHDGAFTAEVWIYAETAASYKPLIGKGHWSFRGWWLWAHSGTSIGARVWAAGATFTINAVPGGILNVWRHVALTFDDAGDRKHRLYADGALIGTSAAASGAIVSDAGDAMLIGRAAAANYTPVRMAWARLSNVVRYAPAGYDVPERCVPPAVDGNTIEQWNMQAGAGATAAAEVSSPTNDGTITGGSWVDAT